MPSPLVSPCVVHFKVDRGGLLPVRATDGSAGYDLYLSEDVRLRGMYVNGDGQVVVDRQMAHTALHAAIPDGYVGQLYIRSSVGSRMGVTLSHGVGVIDSDYRGEIGIPLVNLDSSDHLFKAGERVAQLVITPCVTGMPLGVNSLDETERGCGGFGSTN